MRAWGLLALALSAACGHTHSARNAPGNVDVRRPPERIEDETAEAPEDPGENAIVVAGGGLVGGGIGLSGERDEEFVYGVGPELSLGYGESDVSHVDDAFFIYPQRSYGANLGWTALANEGTGVGPLYGELYFGETLLWAAGGWSWDPNDRIHGPQITLTMVALYVRLSHQLDHATQITGGISVKIPHSFVWSR